jgi:hypothetical protein
MIRNCNIPRPGERLGCNKGSFIRISGIVYRNFGKVTCGGGCVYLKRYQMFVTPVIKYCVETWTCGDGHRRRMKEAEVRTGKQFVGCTQLGTHKEDG